MTENENQNAMVVVTNGHVAGVVRALQRDVSGLTPEMVNEGAMEVAATILAYMDELDGRCPDSVAMMLAIVGDNYDPQIRAWAKAAFDFVDGDELRRANRQLELAMYGARQRYEFWEAWKRHAGVAPSVAA